MSSDTYSLDADSILGEYTSTACPRPSDQSLAGEQVLQSIQIQHSRPSFAGHDESDVQYVDSRSLAIVFVEGLICDLASWTTPRNGSAIDADDLYSKLRQVLESYCAEIQSTDHPDGPLPHLIQNPLHQKVHSMVLKEIHFLVGRLASLFYGDVMLFPGSVDDISPVLAARDYLMSGKAFGRLKLRIRRLLKQHMMWIISDEVRLNLLPTAPRLTTSTFHVRWELFDHILNEQNGSTDIGKILTVTGKGRNAYASRCADYFEWLWKDSKYDICSHIQQYLERELYEHPDATLMIDENTEGDSDIKVIVHGAVETITEVAQQLAWLTAAFRSRPEGVTLSDVDFIPTKGMQFFIEAGALTNVSNVTPTPNTCWHRLIRNVAIAHGFPIPPRSHQVGLELPYAAMLKLSRVSTLLIANKRLAFYGFSSLLFPIDQSSEKNDSAQHLTQWHFETSDNTEQYFDCADYLVESKCIWANDVHESTLPTSRHFVGYCRVSEFRLATSTSNLLNLLETPMPDASTTVGARIENVTAGTGGLGFGTLEVESNIRYAHSIVNAVAADEYLGTMDTLERMSMILWDCGDECGWLVPAQALLLHMAHVWVNSKGITAEFRHPSQGPGYLQEVDKILREDRKKVLRKEGRDDDSDFELRHLIMRIWNDIRGCMLAQQSALRDDRGVIGHQAGGISGWEVTDFLTRPPLEFSMKQDKRGPSDKSWKGLAAEKNIPVLFCKGAGEVIKTTPSGFLCAHCSLSLKHQSYLIASLTCLGNMAQRYGGFKSKTRLTTEWGWQPTDEAALFQEYCQLNVGTRCNERLQKLITFKEEDDGTNLNLPANGVVVFGRAGSKAPELAATATPTTTATASVGKGRITKWLAKLRDKKNAIQDALQPNIQVTTNLASALKYAPRHLKQSKHAAGERLWVDAICINQADDAEKSSQVVMMGRIYSQSGIVICWLGLPADSIFAAIDAMETVAYERYVHGTYTENQGNRHRLVACIEQLKICLESIKGADAFGDLQVVDESSMEVSLVGDVELHALANTLQLTTVVLYDLLQGSYGTELRTGQETLVGTFHNIKGWHDQFRSRTCKLDASLVRQSHRVGFLLALLSFRINKFRMIVQDYLLQLIYDEGYRNVSWLEYHPWLAEVKGVIGESHATPAQPLFEVPYWSRIWIRQEIILAKYPVFVCGPRSFSTETLESFSAWVEWIQDPSNFELTKEAGLSRLAVLAYQRIGKLLNHIFASRQDKGGTGCHWLGTKALKSNIWWESPDARATNPKDYYYGFLGLTNLKVTPDYSPKKTLGLISRDFMHEYLKASRGESLSSGTLGGPLGLLMFAGVGYGWDVDQDMPSWGPNFAGQALAKPSSRGQADALISPDPWGFRNVFKTASEAKITGADMEVSAIILDYVEDIGPRVSDYGRAELLHPQGLPIAWAFDFAIRQRGYVSGGHPLTALRTLLEPSTESKHTLANMATEDCLEFVKFLVRFSRVLPNSKLPPKVACARLWFMKDYFDQVPRVCEDREWEDEEVTDYWEFKDHPVVMVSKDGWAKIMHESWEVFLESLMAHLVNKWAADCVNTHSACRRQSLPGSVLPTRLLDIGSNISKQWVVATTEGDAPRYGKYVALSHRWATDTPKLLHQGGFRAQSAYCDRELPQHYQDIISICRAMGIRYLWIDSLCIFQDSDEDFRHEAGIMADIYENAFLTLSICWDYSSASLFRETVPQTIPRPPPADHLASRDKCCKESSTILDSRAFVKYEDGFRVDVVDSLINRRGWVLQERFLSPRILYLGNEQIYWECDAHIASELVLQSLKDWGSRWDSQTNLCMGLGHLSWRSIMIPYSACSLTRQEDKLVAISGLARSLVGRTGQTYFCGIWIEYWIQDLLWYPVTLLTVHDTTQLTELSDSPEVPSWLWLGSSKRINPGFIPREPDLLYSNLCSFKSNKAFAMAFLIDSKLKSPGANTDVFTSFAGASLDIICLPIQISFNKEEMIEEHPYPITGTFLCRYADIKARGGQLSCLPLQLIPDISKCDEATFEEADVIYVQSSQQYDPLLPCFLVPLLAYHGTEDEGADRFLEPSMNGLVVQPITEGQFKRIACFWQMGGNKREVTCMVLKAVSEQKLGAHGTSETDEEQAYKAAFLQYATAKTSLPMFVDSGRDAKLSWSQVPQIKDLSWTKIELV
ncbi:hypothetical protein FIE12Z_10133 [Fusarium flagelliforme]|uniref:Heterokaryon incompatibility domain-containing protein n=1 Tax=Fusarium flagelliforme TaxID=2675880 RepID=A0A395MCQ2_9HYPO|nr:hypothetical protein FIE12Z_10133 [Fusarium flagelliforme]